MPVIYIKLRAIFQPNGDLIDFLKSNWIGISYLNLEFELIYLIIPDSDRISTLEPFISRKMGYYMGYVSHLGFLSPASI